MLTSDAAVRVSEEFSTLTRTATGYEPYDYQLRVAEEGLPEVLAVPTGCGKTQAAVLGWLFRRRFHPNPLVRSFTPHWLVFVLPMRVLAEQTVGVVGGWLEALDLGDEVGLHLLMGGEPRTSSWRLKAERDTILVGTLDMVVSRLLNRGYGESRFMWPVDFGLFNSGCQFVFDEVQLMGPALATTRQLHGLRRRFGEAVPCRSTWMSATVDDEALSTVDAPTWDDIVELSPADRSGHLATRLDATKRVEELAVDPDPRHYARDVAREVAARHCAGTTTLVILNTVERARQTHDALARLFLDEPAADIVLLHSRFRPDDRQVQVRRAVIDPVDADGWGRIVVSTQVVEAGVDLSAATLVTEAAPWPSVVQRAGRCNRDGQTEGAVLAWVRPPKPLPYEAADVDAATTVLVDLEGVDVTPHSLRERDVAVSRPILPVLRSKDLLELFDTAPDLGGNDVDVARFIRDADDLDVTLAWRQLGPDGPTAEDPLPSAAERCPVPVGEAKVFRAALAKRPGGGLALWRFDHLADQWLAAGPDDIKPGATFLVSSGAGGYRPHVGWDRDARAPVEPVAVINAADGPANDELDADDRALDDDSTSFGVGWVHLDQHLADVEGEAAVLLAALAPDGLKPDGIDADQVAAVAVAARYHDLGKAHPAFQAMLRGSTAAESPPPPEVLLAKSPAGRGARNERRHYRHELASMLALSDPDGALLAGMAEADLVRYLVAAHHGRIRLGCRAHPGEASAPPGRPRRVLGVEDGEQLPAVPGPSGTTPAVRLSLDLLALGSAGGSPSWTATALALRDRADLGVFRLGFLEAVLRLADWRASATPGRAHLGGAHRG